MKDNLYIGWVYLRARTAGKGGEVSFWTIIGALIIAAAYFAYPGPFHTFFASLIDFTLDTVRDAFRGGVDGNPDKKLQVK